MAQHAPRTERPEAQDWPTTTLDAADLDVQRREAVPHDVPEVERPAEAEERTLPPTRHGGRRVRGVAVAAALFLAACAIGVGVGYAVQGTSTTTSTVPATAGRTTGRQQTLAQLKAAVAPELVNIDTTFSYQTMMGAGTGMVVSSNGRVITNNHVVAGAMKITATDLWNGKTYGATVVGYDASHDVAVLQLDGASTLPTVTFAGSRVRIGQRVAAIGNAGGAGKPTALGGVVTGLDRTIAAQSELSGVTEHLHGMIETSVAVRSGQSGGPLVNGSGRVIGMVTAGSSDYTISQQAGQGYAVPTAMFRSIAGDILKGRASTTVHIGATAFLGVLVASTSGTGALVVKVLSTSPAAIAGLAPGDRIVGLAGHSISGPATVSALIAEESPGATLELRYVDGAGQVHTTTITLVAGPAA